jgi:hypothetical protein
MWTLSFASIHSTALHRAYTNGQVDQAYNTYTLIQANSQSV